jgi:hypothetical protein
LTLAGCGDDKSAPTAPGTGGGGGNTTFTGLVAGASQSGTLTLTIPTTSLAGRRPTQAAHSLRPAPAAIITVTGSVNFALQGFISFTGTYNTETDSIHFAATDSLGGVYQFYGWVDNGSTLTVTFGGYTGPHGVGGWGMFRASPAGVVAYCGTYAESPGGVITFLISEVAGTDYGRIVGVVWPTGGSRGFPFKGYAVENEPPDANRTLEIDGDVPGDYSIFGAGSLVKASGSFSGEFSVVDSTTVPPGAVAGYYTGGICN